MIADITRFKEVFGSVKAALIIVPQKPTLDHMASALALALSMRKNGITITVSCPEPMTVEFNRLVGVESVREDLGDKNLVISFANYPSENIERVSYNIDDGRFDLTIIPKVGFNAPSQDQIVASHSGVSSDFVIVVGANYPNDLGKFAQNKELVEGEKSQSLSLVGSTPLSGWPKAIELIDASVVSISEVVFDLIEHLKLPIDQDIATNLLLGLESGTRNFTAAGVTADTFAKASQLLRSGAKRTIQNNDTHQFSHTKTLNSALPHQDLQPKYKDSTRGGEV